MLFVGLLLLAAGAVLGQIAPEHSFERVQQLGQLAPRGVRYDANFDRFVWVSPQGQLQLADAATYQVQHTLYETGNYNAYEFSHDGRWLALAIDLRVEVWDTQSGTLSVDFAPDGALNITGPLLFSDDDTLLLLNAIVRAPQETRRSENDTTNLPWLWDISAARRERRSILPNAEEARAFFDFRNGFFLTSQNRLLGALPQRLQLLDISDGYPLLLDIPTERFERDPLDIWYSVRDQYVYFRPLDAYDLLQINPETNIVTDIPLGRELNYRSLTEFSGLALSDQARIIGQANSLESNSFLRLLLGDDYRNNFNYHPLTVMLIDILRPMTPTAEYYGFLVYIFDETTGRGMFDFVRPLDGTDIALHPDGVHLMVRRASGEQAIEVYNPMSQYRCWNVTNTAHGCMCTISAMMVGYRVITCAKFPTSWTCRLHRIYPPVTRLCCRLFLRKCS
jgi:hypothetical protein